jgi:hypothetical protein
MVVVVRVPFPSNPKEFDMLMSFAFAIATMIAVLGCQTVLKLVNGPDPLRSC